ncbi:MAG TPA: phosphate ABC transporter permease subunit PstC [Solirubrobacterales bacterium]|jgi:phosphate transport system permease protein|nr:phosphate ABC transporter permease subunit PstC [Solirubrobacterales bacterium]
MSTTVSSAGPQRAAVSRSRSRDRRRSADRFADGLLYGVCALAALLGVVLILVIGYQVAHGASPAISKFGLGFLVHTTWQPNFGAFGAGSLLFGTAVSSFVALLIGAPIAISIGLYLSLLAPAGVRGVVSPLVEMLAAIPSVILGFWGILVLAPFVHEHLEPWLHGTLGFIPIFGAPETTGASVFTASLILTIMVVPIIASVSRDLFLAVPRDVQDGASALGATRWEVVRGVVLPSTASGVVAASLLGLGRALGEAIAVTQVIGAGAAINASLFKTGDTLASRIANQFPGAITDMHKASLFYLGVILLVIGLLSNLIAQWIGRRFDYQRMAAK